MPPTPPIRVLALDDHPLMRTGLGAFIDTESGIEVVGEEGNGEAALERCRELRPDVVLMDLSMPVMDGLETIRALLDESPTPGSSCSRRTTAARASIARSRRAPGATSSRTCS